MRRSVTSPSVGNDGETETRQKATRGGELVKWVGNERLYVGPWAGRDLQSGARRPAMWGATKKDEGESTESGVFTGGNGVLSIRPQIQMPEKILLFILLRRSCLRHHDGGRLPPADAIRRRSVEQLRRPPGLGGFRRRAGAGKADSSFALSRRRARLQPGTKTTYFVQWKKSREKIKFLLNFFDIAKKLSSCLIFVSCLLQAD